MVIKYALGILNTDINFGMFAFSMLDFIVTSLVLSGIAYAIRIIFGDK